jgi:hypothetical protein
MIACRNAAPELTVHTKARMAAEAVRSSLLRFCFSAFLHFLTSLFYGRSCFFHGSTRLFFGLIHCFIYGFAGLVDFRPAGAERERREPTRAARNKFVILVMAW